MATVAETRRRPAAPARSAAPSPTPVAYAARRLQTGLRPNSPAAYGAAVLLVAVAALVRLGVGLLELQSPLVFSTFYPAILLAILIGGAGPALLATGLSALAGLVLFLPQGASVTHGSSVVVSLSLFLGANLFTIWAVRGYQARISRLVAEDAHNLTLSREQNHRVRNALFIIETIVRGSLKDDPTRARTINQRIRGALSFVDIRYGASSRPIGVAALLTRQLEPFGLEQFDIDADASPLPASAQHLIALAAHELATNAMKHGALSTPDGRVSVGFAVGDRRATLSWRESGGPRVVEPNRRGYGSVLLRRLVEAAGGEIVLHFRPDGLAAKLTLPFPAPRR
jgi:two-component sensor histidine kinase